tara:strand:+ start:361 stop:873 length:513 start_codon:yes stop_codon:yes gene_type:complete
VNRLKYKVINNFLDDDFFNYLTDLIFHEDFNWFRKKTMTEGSKIDLGYFTHSFYNEMNVTSEHYRSYILPILIKLEAAAAVQIRANMFPSVFYKNKKGEWHSDYPFLCKTAILYLQDCDGGTELKINNKNVFIKSQKNKIVVFDSDVKHRGVVSKNSDFRHVINFNYFPL